MNNDSMIMHFNSGMIERETVRVTVNNDSN